MYWIDLVKDIRLWRRFAKISKQNREYLEKNKMRVDRLGRIYTVINLPEEVSQGNEYMHEAWVLQHLKPFTQVLLEIGLADYTYPEVSKIEEPNTAAYLVVMYPEVETISFKRIVWNLFLWTASFFIIRAVYRFVIDSPAIMSKINAVIDYIF